MQVAERANGRARHATSADCARSIIKEEGFQGLFSGLPATLMRETPQQLIYFPAYHFAKYALQHVCAGGFALPASSHAMAAGAFAGVATWLPPFYWVDVVKSRLETSPPGTYEGFVDCARHVYREEGGAYFFRGLSAALMRAAVLHSTLFVV